MAFLGQIPKATIQYTAAIGPIPGTGEPMESDVITSALVGVVAATVINPIVGVAAFTSWMAFGPKKKSKSKSQTQGG